MMSDSIKFNLLPYPSHIGSPKFEIENTSPFVKKSLTKFEKYYNKRAIELKKEIEEFTRKCEINDLVLNSEISFEPLVGETYYLYNKDTGKMFLSLISPDLWKQDFVCSVELNSDGYWDEKKL